MKKKRVLFVATVVKTHIMHFHLPYLKQFQDMGWETAVAARNDYEAPGDCRIPYCDTYYDVPFERIPWKKQNHAAYRMMKQIIQEGNFDLIHCHTPVGSVLARMAARQARKTGTKVIYTAHGFHFYKGAPLLNWLLFFPAEWLMSACTDLLITINREDYARAKKCMMAKKIVYVPGVGVDTSRFHPDAAVRQEKRKELGFREEDFLLLTVAELTPNKNHITIVRALSLLKREPAFQRMHYLIVGRGESRAYLEEETRELGLEDHVHFLGYRTDAADLYRCSDLFLFMPYREGLSVALMEAMGSALPILCTKIRGNEDLMEDGVSGAFAKNDPQEVAKSILELYADPEKRKAYGEAAARRVRGFDSETVHKIMQDLYLSM